MHSTPGIGSTFWFTIPIELCECPPKSEQTASPSLGDESSPEGDSGPSRILVAEDYPPSQDVAKMHLESAGHTIDIASDGLQAVEMCEAAAYDLIFMDVQMPHRDGLEATSLIRSGNSPCRSTPIIGFTANADETTHLACIKVGMNDVIPKPVRRNSLIAAVREWTARTNNAADVPPNPMNAICEHDVAGAGNTNTPIDFDEALREFGGDKDLVASLIEKFISSVESQIETLTRALDNEDHEILRQEAHKIRGGAANLAARPLATTAENLENHARARQLDEAKEQIDALSNEFDRLRTTALHCGYAKHPTQENER